MKKEILVFVWVLLNFVAIQTQAQQQATYDVTAGNGNGLRFWAQDSYKIHMGNTPEYRYGDVTDYSIKMNMNDEPDRGWTWGVMGSVPVAAINTQGHMQIAGRLTVGDDIHLPSINGNKQIYTWSPTDENWRIGMSASPGFTRSLSTSHVQYVTYRDNAGQGFAVGVHGGLSSFEVQGSDHAAFFRGNVGIGAATPLQKLDVRGNLILESGTSPYIFTGTGSAELNRYLSILNSPGKQNASGLKAGGILVSDAYSYANPSKNDLIVKGKVGIGTPLTTNPNSYTLAVNGKIGAKDVQIEGISTTWPDYVFEPAYNLLSLSQLEQYIQINKHLPEVPSATIVEEKGYSMSELDVVLLKKVEELTLYIIEQQKQIDALKVELKNK